MQHRFLENFRPLWHHLRPLNSPHYRLLHYRMKVVYRNLQSKSNYLVNRRSHQCQNWLSLPSPQIQQAETLTRLEIHLLLHRTYPKFRMTKRHCHRISSLQKWQRLRKKLQLRCLQNLIKRNQRILKIAEKKWRVILVP
ncbi:hypothetical protein EMPG_11573 [Blastomyces silverae]|uniref:Uncharacterized protein n=1 Tax=Blastomyces silverae TaxID=2060906 RepID=A0A0H1BQ74_9EURO|nr:hypothetical protein EMPG_11573 [Blastomyces silverae]